VSGPPFLVQPICGKSADVIGSFCSRSAPDFTRSPSAGLDGARAGDPSTGLPAQNSHPVRPPDTAGEAVLHVTSQGVVRGELRQLGPLRAPVRGATGRWSLDTRGRRRASRRYDADPARSSKGTGLSGERSRIRRTGRALMTCDLLSLCKRHVRWLRPIQSRRGDPLSHSFSAYDS
jgi:hypothetical protein